MTPLVVLVEIRVKPADHERFQQLVAENAAASLREPGCRRFDVLAPDAAADRFVLYEIYDDDDAFKAHLQTDHYFKFDETSAAMVIERAIRQLRFVGPEPAASRKAPA